jgi:hypothetical protein
LNIRRITNVLLVLTIILTATYFGYGLAAERFTWIPYPESKYVNLLTALKAEGYSFVLPRDVCTNGIVGKTVMIVHYADTSIHGAPMFVNVEQNLGIRSAFYLRADVDYFTQSILYFQELQTRGWEIGFTNDMLSRASGNVTQAKILFIHELAYMRSFFSITTVRYHGDEFNVNIHNNVYMLPFYQALGLCNVSDWPGASYVKDTNHVYMDGGRGQLVILELHTDWW